MISSGHTSLLRPASETLRGSEGCRERWLWGARGCVRLSDLARGTGFRGRLRELSGRSVLLRTHDQLATAVALIELQGVARRIVLCPGDVLPEHLVGAAEGAGVDAVVSDGFGQGTELRLDVPVSVEITPVHDRELECAGLETEWVLLTSGTTGAPKMLGHKLSGLTGAIRNSRGQSEDVVWGTFYDIRRYGGLQIFLRGVLGTGSMVLSEAGESLPAHLARLAARGVTHLTGTPSHWRRVLMSPSSSSIRPRYIRLSGEIADQAVLNTLASVYPDAAIGHAFASTEAGVVFEVTDGLEGFPASLVGQSGEVAVIVANGSLRVRSSRTATGYVGDPDGVLVDDRGFVDTGDMVERRGERYYFLGRRTGVVNVGGEKVYPEEVEAVLTRHPAVRMARVRARRNPITGALVVADIVLDGQADGVPVSDGTDQTTLGRDILRFCRGLLPRHKVPVALAFVTGLDVAASGKVARDV